MEKQKTALAQNNTKQLAVVKAQETADKARLVYDKMPSVANLAAQRQACLEVFKARLAYIKDLGEQVLTELFKAKPELMANALILGGVPFLITVNTDRLTFELTDTATGEIHNGFNAVETFLLNKLK